MAEKGVCIRCGEKFGFGLSYGFCSTVCMEETHAEERQEGIKEYPYAVIDSYDEEHEVFKTYEHAQEYLSRLCSNMEIVKRK